ncbi:integrase, catalytic region, zinc finger, CCHC-type containing protein [Tanacetum coccineum]
MASTVLMIKLIQDQWDAFRDVLFKEVLYNSNRLSQHQLAPAQGFSSISEQNNCREIMNMTPETEEKMLLCKQAEKGVQLQAEQSDWLADTDEEIDEQELEAHYSYMAKIQEVPNADSGTDAEPLEQVQYDTDDNVFANDIQHFEQSESITNTCAVETGDSNVIPDSPDMCDNDIQDDQNDVECDDERVALANLIANLKLDVDENKKIQKQLKKANATLTQELTECKSILAETSRTLGESNSIRDSCLVALQNKQTEFERYKAFNDRTVDYDKLERKLNETLGLLAQKEIDIKEGLKVKAYEISVVKEKHDELVKQSLLTKSHYEGLVKEKTKVITDLKLKEEKDIDKMISMENQLKFLNEIVYKRSQSIQTIHMLAPKCPTFNGRPTFANPKLIPDREETLTLEEESLSKLNKDLVKHSNDHLHLRNPTAQDMEILVKTCLILLALKTHNDSFAFVYELKQEMHADLKYVESLKEEIDELESDKAEFSNLYDMLLQECVSNDIMCSYLQSSSDLDEITELQCLYLHKVRECDCLAQKLSEQTEFVKQLKNDTVFKEKASNVFRKEREQYFEIQDLKAQLQDKKIAISELKKLIEKCKGKSVETKFDKPSVVRQPNAQRIPKPSVLGKLTPFSDSLERKSFSKTKSVPKTNVSEGLSKPVTTQMLPQTTRQAIVQLIYHCFDSGCTKHMAGNLKLLCNFVEKYLGTVHFTNDQFAPILGYRDLVQGNIMINGVYYGEGLNHNLFSVGQFCDADLEVAFRKSTCFVRDLQGNDLLTGNSWNQISNKIPSETTSSTPIYFMAKASPTQAWLWHQRLYHLNFNYINLLSQKDVVIGLPKLKYVKDQLCSSLK